MNASFKTLVLQVLFCSLFFLCAERQTGTKLDDSVLLLEKAFSLSPEQYDSIWPGFNLNDFSIAVYNENSAYLVGHPDPGADFVFTGREIAGHRLYHSGRKVLEFTANTSIEYRGIATAILQISEYMPDYQFFALLFHEVFHSFSRTLKGVEERSGSLAVQLFFPSDDAEYYSLAYIEQLLLKNAYIARDDEECRAFIEAFYAVYDRRTARAYTRFADYEFDEQINEGLAEYAGNKGLELFGFDYYCGANLTLMLDEMTEKPSGFRLRCYYTGRALAEMLDRFYPGWKQDLTEKVNLLDLLKAKVAPAGAVNLDTILTEYNYEQFLSTFSSILRGYRKSLVRLEKSITENSNILIYFPAVDFVQFRFDPMNMTAVNNSTLHHSRFVRLFNNEAAFDLSLMGIPALTESADENIYAIGTVRFLLPSSYEIEIDGKRTGRLTGQASFNRLSLTADGVSLFMGNGTVVKKIDCFEITAAR